MLDRLDDLQHLGGRLGPDGCDRATITYDELCGSGTLRYLVSSGDGRKLIAAVLEGAARRLGRRVAHLREIGKEAVLALPPEDFRLRRQWPRSASGTDTQVRHRYVTRVSFFLPSV